MLSRLLLLTIIAIILFAIKRHLSGYKPNHSQSSTKPHNAHTTISRKEALYILGLQDPTSETEIMQAYKRLIGKVHPDKGGTDFFASQLNLAKETLLSTKNSARKK